jgi:hypothetical protein
MADKKISQMALLSAVDLNPAVDYLPIVDPSEPAAADQNKRILAASIVVNAALGTPVSGTLTNCTGLPIVAGTTGTLSVARGGTGLTSYTAGSVVYSEDGTSLTSGIKFGTAPEDIVLNQFLSGMAYQDPNNVTIGGGSATLTSLTATTVTATTVTGTSMVYNGAELSARLNPLAQAVSVQMTAAASGSNGIQVLNNANLNMGTNDFTLHWEGSLPDWTPAATIFLAIKSLNTSTPGMFLYVETTGVLVVGLYAGTGANTIFSSTVSTGLSDGASAKITVIVVRETASSAGSVVFYVNGVQLGASVPITAGATYTVSNSVVLYLTGSSIARAASVTQAFRIYNRALTAAEVLSLNINGVALADRGATQTALTSGTLVIGGKYRIDTFVAGDSFTNVGAGSNASGVEFVATGTTPTTWTNSSSLRRIGLTSELLASNAQSNTGQIFDTSGNKNHALLPASGATVVGRPVSQTREVRWTNTWAGTNELQYIGGVNQAILPANAYIESIVGTVSGATPHDIIIGDGSDTDRYVTITTGLAAGTTSFTLANQTTDGTNLKLTVDPDTDATMSIAWVISYRTLEA